MLTITRINSIVDNPILIQLVIPHFKLNFKKLTHSAILKIINFLRKYHINYNKNANFKWELINLNPQEIHFRISIKFH